MKIKLSYFKEIYSLLGKNKNKFPVMTLLFFILSISELLSLAIIYPYLKIIIDYETFISNYGHYISFIDYTKQSLFLSISIIILIVFFIKSFFAIYIKKTIFNYAQQAAYDIRIKLLTNFQSFSYLKYLNKNTSEYIYSIDTLTAAFLSSLRNILTIFSEILVFIAISIILGINSITMLIFSFISIGLFYIFYDFAFAKKLFRYGKDDNFYSVAVVKTVIDSVNGFKLMKLLKLNNFFLNRLIFNQTKFMDVRLKMEVIKILPKHSIETIAITLVVVSALYFTVYLEVNTKDYISMIALFGVAAIRIIPSSTVIISCIANIRRFRNSISLLYNDSMLNSENSIKKNISTDKNKLTKLVNFQNLEIKNLFFKYLENGNFVIKDLSLKINKGEKIGIIGESGSGKSTLIDLILGLLPPNKGQILVNEILIEEEMENWHSKVFFTPQDIYLIDDTLENNIALGQEEKKIDLSKLKNSIKSAELESLIQGREENYRMHIGDKGLKISGGQKQRIAIARLFYFDSEFVILDEATSALDEETEKLIYKKIFNFLSNKTAIIISHNENNLKNCSKIYELKNGKLVIKNHDS